MDKYRINGKPACQTMAALVALADIQPELRQIIRDVRARTSDSILRHKQLKDKCGRADSTIHADISNGVFPPGFPIGTRATGYSSNEIDAWISACLYASRSKAPVNMKAFITLLVQSRELVTDQGGAV